jgi:hypothetical protein
MQAERACRLDSDRAKYGTALGAAHYRLGRYQEALETLKQASEEEKLVPANLAFQAMAQHRLARAEAARATLARLRNLIRQPPGAKDAEARDLLLEAEALIETRTKSQTRVDEW